MKVEIKIEAEMTNDQCDVFVSELISTAKMIGIKLKVEQKNKYEKQKPKP